MVAFMPLERIDFKSFSLIFAEEVQPQIQQYEGGRAESAS